MESFIKVLIYIHAAFGGFALLAGFISIAAKKGGLIHKKSGIIYYYSMLISGITALIVASMPNHYSPFLFAIGIFSMFFVLTGYRALKFKKSNPNLQLDKWISYIMIVTGVLMVFLPLVLTKSINVILLIFGSMGILFSVKDLLLFNNSVRLKNKWLKLHISRMIGGYISATTAFIVVNQIIPGIFGWILPGILGSLVIVYWSRKTKVVGAN